MLERIERGQIAIGSNNLLASKAIQAVIIDHTTGLHMGVNNGRADKFKTTSL